MPASSTVFVPRTPRTPDERDVPSQPVPDGTVHEGETAPIPNDKD
jgi:hypothetical protein